MGPHLFSKLNGLAVFSGPLLLDTHVCVAPDGCMGRKANNRPTAFQKLTRPTSGLLLHEFPLECVIVVQYFTDGGVREMTTEIQSAAVGKLCRKPTSGRPCRVWELAEHRGQVGVVELKGMMRHIAPENRLFAHRRDRNGRVTDAVTRRRDKAYPR